MRALIFGAGGMLGRDLVAYAPPNAQVIALDHAACDVTEAQAVSRALATATPDWVLNAAAYTAVDRAESERELAMRINGEAPGVIGRAAAAAGVRVLHVSTDYVFPGTGDRPWCEDDAADPVNWYGATKLAGERALTASGAMHLVVRVQWLYGLHGPSFPRTMLTRAREGKATRVVNDQRGAPTPTDGLARALWGLVGREAHGAFHVASQGETTWYDVAARIFNRVGCPDRLSPCTSAEYPTPARRPANGVLDLRRAAEAGTTLPHWTDSLDDWLTLKTRLDGAFPNG